MLPNCDFQPNTEPSIPSTSSGGTVTNFSFTNQKGFTGTVTNATTTPNLALDYSPTLTLTITSAGTTSLNSNSNIIQAFTGVTTQTLVLPLVTTLSAGKQYQIINKSTGTITINTFGGALIGSLSSGNSAIITLLDNTIDVVASWYYNLNQTTSSNTSYSKIFLLGGM